MASRLARRGGFDLVHAQSRVADADVFSLHWCPHAFWVRDILARKPRWSDGLRTKLDEGMLRGAEDRTYMPVSGLQKEVFEAEYGQLPGIWTTVHPGVDTARFAPERLAGLRDAACRELRLPPDAVIALFEGMNFESKGRNTLIASCDQCVTNPAHA
jgi:hypothetical protein